MKKEKMKIEIKSFIYCLLSFAGLVNFFVWIRMADKMRAKKLKMAGIISVIVCLALMLIASFLTASDNTLAFSQILTAVAAMMVFVPIVVVFGFRKEYVRRQTLILEVREHNINVERLDVQAYEQISLSEVPKLAESSRKLYGEKGDAVLRAIKLSELEKDRVKAQARLQEERKKEIAAEEEARLKREEIEIARERTRIEAEKLKAERAKAEAERAEAEKAKAEAERARAEAEKAKKEIEKARVQIKAEQINDKKTGEKEEEFRKSEIRIENTGIKKVDVNSCSEQELSIVPGIGIILSKKAIDIRNEKGDFHSIEEFIELVGIRAANIERVKPYLQCAGQKEDPREQKKKQGRKIDL